MALFSYICNMEGVTDTFKEAVFRAVALIPRGRVASYGQVAQMAGYSEGAARAVGNALHTNTDSGKTPCHRVVTSSGQMGSNYGFGGPELQRSILKAEGVRFIGDRVDMAQSGIAIEDHPLLPFLPPNARIFFLGSFPPPVSRWSMNFFYPNWINDFWRIQGLIHFDDPHHFEMPQAKQFDRQLITRFCSQQGFAFYDTASRVCRLKGNAMDEFLFVIRYAPIAEMLSSLPDCKTIVTTGGKASDSLLTILKRLETDGTVSLMDTTAPPPHGSSTHIIIGGRKMEWWRMPSTSRAYPMPLPVKADSYRQLFPQLLSPFPL